jgi:hypothetical protein
VEVEVESSFGYWAQNAPAFLALVWFHFFVQVADNVQQSCDFIEDLFPSGPWTGFYNHGPGDRHRMDLILTFKNGVMEGDGNDDVGRFLIRGRYEPQTRECHWTKTYVGAHDVFYRGFREGKGIWGTWEITIRYHGGFHIWPRSESCEEVSSESSEMIQPADAVAVEFSQ